MDRESRKEVGSTLLYLGYMGGLVFALTKSNNKMPLVIAHQALCVVSDPIGFWDGIRTIFNQLYPLSYIFLPLVVYRPFIVGPWYGCYRLMEMIDP